MDLVMLYAFGISAASHMLERTESQAILTLGRGRNPSLRKLADCTVGGTA